MLFLIILIVSLICSYFLPWWFVAVIAFAAAWFLGKKPGKTFLSGFAAVFAAWVILALFKSIPNDNILATRMAQLFQLPNWWLLLIVTGFTGGLISGLSALSAVLFKRSFTKRQ
ncbi:MAG TPA: hypothetical protein VJ844_13375 [Mucilaginibacter sp.]|nr:hypothetical protein [Mucilaginibacter sp.]